jgi:hypothetical protein
MLRPQQPGLLLKQQMMVDYLYRVVCLYYLESVGGVRVEFRDGNVIVTESSCGGCMFPVNPVGKVHQYRAVGRPISSVSQSFIQ